MGFLRVRSEGFCSGTSETEAAAKLRSIATGMVVDVGKMAGVTLMLTLWTVVALSQHLLRE